MAQQKLQQLLEELQLELNKNQELTEQESAQLDNLLTTIRLQSQQPVESDVVIDLEKQAVIFSENHPLISTSLTQIINTLARIGI